VLPSQNYLTTATIVTFIILLTGTSSSSGHFHWFVAFSCYLASPFPILLLHLSMKCNKISPEAFFERAAKNGAAEKKKDVVNGTQVLKQTSAEDEEKLRARVGAYRRRSPHSPVESQIWFDGHKSGIVYKDKA
jgi:hypothetical protein